jgi:hypothetical protein
MTVSVCGKPRDGLLPGPGGEPREDNVRPTGIPRVLGSAIPKFPFFVGNKPKLD